MKIKVEDNLKTILQYLEETGYQWCDGQLPTEYMPHTAKYIETKDDFIVFSQYNDDELVTLEEYIISTTTNMNRNNILPGYTITLENGNSFKVMKYMDKKIVFSEGSCCSIHSLDKFCHEDLSPKDNISRIMVVRNALGAIMWERKFTRSDIKPGYVLTNDIGTKYLVVDDLFSGLRIIPIGQYTIGALLTDIMNEDMSPATESHSEIIEVKDDKCKVLYSK